MSDDNIFEFPAKERKDKVMRDRTNKVNNFTNPFTNTDYKINSYIVDGVEWKTWIPPSLDSINSDTISFENINWSFNLTNSNQTLLADAMDLCNAIQKQCIGLSVENDSIQLNMVLDKLREALVLSKISSK
jgi:hypothetical protein